MQTHADPITGETLPGSKDERIAALEADLAAAHSRNEQWMAAVRDIGHAVNCLYSVFPDANDHIVRAIEKVKSDLAAAQAEVAAEREACAELCKQVADRVGIVDTNRDVWDAIHTDGDAAACEIAIRARGAAHD